MRKVMNIEPAVERLRAFGSEALEVDGHDVEALSRAADRPHPDKPLAIVARTDPCRGIEILRERAQLHHVRFQDDEERQRYAQLLAEWES